MDELAHLGPQVAMVLHYLHERPLLSLSISKPNYHIVVSTILLSRVLEKFLSNSPFLIFLSYSFRSSLFEMNLNTKLSFSYPNFIWGLVILDRAWLMVLDAMILTSHKNEPQKAYLPGSKDTVISKAVPSGRDSTIALRWR